MRFGIKFTTYKAFSIILILMILSGFFIVSYTTPTSSFIISNHPSTQLTDGWEYRWDDSPIDADNIPEWTYLDLNSTAWQPLPELGWPGDHTDQTNIWLRYTLPDEQWRDPAIFIPSTAQIFEVYLNQQLIYRFGNFNDAGIGQFSGRPWHLIALPLDFQGKQLNFRIYSSFTNRGLMTEAILASQATHLQVMFLDDFHNIITVSLWLLMSLVALFFFYKNSTQKIYLAFVLFAVSASVDRIGESQIKQIFLNAPDFWFFAKEVADSLALLGLSLFMEQLWGAGYLSVFRRLWQVWLGITFVNIILLVTSTQATFVQDILIPFLVVITLLLFISEIIRNAFIGNVEARILAGGFGVFLITGIYFIILLILGRSPSSYWLTGGLLAFFGSMVLVLGNRFFEVYAQLEVKSVELEQQSKELARKNVELQKLDRLKDEFLANTSHELRTPLNGIIGLTGSLIDGAAGPLPVMAKRNLAMVVSAGERLSSLVNNILDFSKLKHKNITLDLRPISIYSVTEVVLALSQPLAEQKPLKLINKIDPDTPAVLADENRIQQIMHNLVGNAIKFTESGQITISAELSQRNRENTFPFLEVTIADTGIGISPEQQEQIFKSFEQGDGSATREYSGTGLGLTITKQLVELHGGEIWVKSKKGQGSQFIYTLRLTSDAPSRPLKVPEPIEYFETPRPPKQVTPSPTPAIERKPSPKQAPSTNEVEVAMKMVEQVAAQEEFSILVVDDEPINLQVLNNYLSLQQYRVSLAINGRDALMAIERGERYDLVLLDLMMPRMSGYDVCRAIRKKYPMLELPILILTAKDQPKDMVMGLNMGANDYLTKPFDKDVLLARVNTLLTLKQAITARDSLVALQQELDIAQHIQRNLLLSASPEWNNLDAICYTEAAREVGGDFYSYHHFTNSHNNQAKYALAIGDVSGKGISAALLMANSLASLQASLNREFSPSKLLGHLDQTLVPHTKATNQNCALVYVEIIVSPTTENNHSGYLCMANAGCISPIIRRSNGETSYIDIGGMPLGVGLGSLMGYQEIKTPISKGDLIILVSDGIVEAQDMADEMFGFERLEEAIARGPTDNAKVMLKHIRAEVEAFVAGATQHDDMTIVVVQI